MMETTYDMSGSVSASMNYLTLQTPSKKSRRNKEDSQPGISVFGIIYYYQLLINNLLIFQLSLPRYV